MHSGPDNFSVIMSESLKLEAKFAELYIFAGVQIFKFSKCIANCGFHSWPILLQFFGFAPKDFSDAVKLT